MRLLCPVVLYDLLLSGKMVIYKPQMNADFHRLIMDGKRVGRDLSLHVAGEVPGMSVSVVWPSICGNLGNLWLNLLLYLRQEA